MKFIQICPYGDRVAALGEDGVVYTLQAHREKLPGTSQNEYGNQDENWHYIHYWRKMDLPIETTS